jgi:branched-chain amino acid transport system substrate-binding protein
VDVDDAINQLKLQKPPIKAVVMVATYRAAAKFIEKTHDLFPGMIYTNVSFVGSTALADELMLLGARYAAGVIVTQVVPAVSGYSSVVLEYKNALAKYYPGEAPDYVSLEGYVAANVLIKGLQRVGPQLDTEKLIDVLENTRTFDLGLGSNLGFGRAEHQASHKIWGTAIDENGKYQAIELE